MMKTNSKFMKKYFNKKIILTLLIFLTLTSFQEDSLKWDYDKREWSPLMIAIYYHETATFTKLINKNKYISFVSQGNKTTWKLTAMEVAIRSGNDIAVELLIKSKKHTSLDYYLFIACAHNDEKIIDLLIDNGADENFIFGNSSSTPLIMATNEGSEVVLIEFLKKCPKTINYQNKAGTTALMFAVSNLNIVKIKILLGNKADKNLKDNKGLLAIDYLKYSKYSYDKNEFEIKKNIIELLKN